MLAHERTFRIRHYECDPYGHVNHANYLRYMQETAFDASAAVGYDMARYAEIGMMWLVRETGITYERPLRYGDSVVVRTWVEAMRGVRSRRHYALRRAADDAVVATAYTDWVLLDAATQRPTAAPAEMAAAFVPEGAETAVSRPERFPDPPPPPDGAVVMRRQVAWADLDPVGHVNNANYLAYLEEAGVQAAALYGWSMTRMAAAGFGVVARTVRLVYQQPALLGDELAITTWISDVRRVSAVRHYTITRSSDGALLLRARTHFVWVDLATQRPIRIPDGFMTDFAGHVAE